MLRFPINFSAGNGLPWVHFHPFQYNCPSPILQKLEFVDKAASTISKPVAMYLPGDYSENINASWNLQDVYTGTANTLSGIMLSNIAAALGNVDQGKLLAQGESAAGKLPFPTDIMIFSGVDPMNLSFNFNMIPYSKEEGDSIVKIVKNFKQAILPHASSAKSVLLNFPDVWDIHFENIQGLGLEINNKYENMCLNSCNVQFISGTENASVYVDGTPTQIRMSLSFQSLRKQFFTDKG